MRNKEIIKKESRDKIKRKVKAWGMKFAFPDKIVDFTIQAVDTSPIRKKRKTIKMMKSLSFAASVATIWGFKVKNHRGPSSSWDVKQSGMCYRQTLSK